MSQSPEMSRTDPAADFERFVRDHGGVMLAVARRILRDEDDARDAVQDALLSAHRSIGSFEGTCQLSTWLHRIVLNAALMRIRSRKRRPEQSLDDMLPRFAEDGHFDTPVTDWKASGIEEALSRRESRHLVREAIDRLPETHRTVLVLRDLEELDTAETAAALGISENAVKIRLHRARQALRAVIEVEARAHTAREH